MVFWELNMKIKLAGLFVIGYLLSTSVLANLDSQINTMLRNGQGVAMYKSSATGVAVISIGQGQHRSGNIAIDMAKQEATKNLLAFLKGERISATEQAMTSYRGDEVVESYYSKMRTDVNGAIKSAYMYKSGKYDGSQYAVVMLSERSKDISKVFEDRKSNPMITARGFASLKHGVGKARTLALEQALRNAVEQYGGVSLASKTTIENSDRYRSKLSAVAKGVVKRYTISKEAKQGGDYMVEIAAEVVEELEGGEQSLDAIKENLGRPSFYLAITDTRLSRMIKKILINNDFEVTPVERMAKYTVVAKVDKLEMPMPAMPDMMGLRTTITVNVKDKHNRQDILMVENDPTETIEVSANKSLRESRSYGYAVDLIKEDFTKAINKHFTKSFQEGQKVLVALAQFDRMRDVDELKECIESLPLTKSVSVGNIENRYVVYEVIYLGNPNDLQIDIMKKSREFRLRGLRAKSNNTGIITFKF